MYLLCVTMENQATVLKNFFASSHTISMSTLTIQVDFTLSFVLRVNGARIKIVSMRIMEEKYDIVKEITRYL